MTSDIETAIQWSKRLEGLLERKFGASGKGLHEKLGSVEEHLSESLVRKVRFIATIRNKLVHDEDYSKMDDRPGFEQACEEAAAEFAGMKGGNFSGREYTRSAGQSGPDNPRQASPARNATSAAQKRASRNSDSGTSWLISLIAGVLVFAVLAGRNEGVFTSTGFGAVAAFAGFYWSKTLVIAGFVAALGAGIAVLVFAYKLLG